MKINSVQHDHDVLVQPSRSIGQIPSSAAHGLAASLGFNFHRILVPIDFSPCSLVELRYAVALAEQFGGCLFLLFVSQGYYHPPDLGPVEATTEAVHGRADAAGKLTELATQNIPGSVPVDILVRNGEPAAQIVNAAWDCKADLILVSIHGYSRLKHFWFGSIAEHVVRRAPCPVLVVRENSAQKVNAEPVTRNR